ncbi:MAG: GNAT family N-acetyltransferase [Gemmatimonadales bacterium]|jgi:ribosomal protein S18 acetylase RimI-like enzyme
MAHDGSLSIRPARSGDREWILALAPRLHDFGPPPWRARDVMDRAVTSSIDAGLTAPEPEQTVLVAESAEHEPLGFVHLHGATDFHTGERHGHVSDIVVAPAAEGRGVGAALMAAAEDWARAHGFRLLSLHVFDANRRARELYERLGYRLDIVKMIKTLR